MTVVAFKQTESLSSVESAGAIPEELVLSIIANARNSKQ